MAADADGLSSNRGSAPRPTDTPSGATARAVLATLPDVVLVYDRSSVVRHANPAFRDSYGFDPVGLRVDEIVSRLNARPLDGKVLPLDRQPTPRALAGEYVVGLRYVICTPDGRDRVVEVSSTPMRVDGEIVNAVTVWHDVTTTSEMELRLRASEERLRLFIDFSPAAIAMFDREMRYVAVSRRWLEDYRITDGNIVGRSHYDVFPDIPERWKKVHRRCLAGAVESCEEDPFPRANGTVDWVRWEIRPWRETTGEVGGLIMFTEVITERMRAEEALRRSEQLYRSIVRNLPRAVVWIVDRDLRCVMAEGSLLPLLGFDRQQIEGRAIDDVLPGDVGAELIGRYRVALAGESRSYETSTRDRVFWSHYAPIRDENGEVHRAMGLSLDVTERKRVEEALRESEIRYRGVVEELRAADRRKNEFLAMLSHELRSPLAPIRNSLYVLDRSRDGSESARIARELIARQVTHLARLVDDLLEVNRITSGKIRLQRAPLDLVALVLRVVDDHRSTFAERDLVFSCDVPDGSLWVNGDATRLEQVVANLLSNAAKFTPAGGHVTLRADHVDRLARVVVRDDGVGIEPTMLAHVFDLFAQADRTLDRSSGGLGLGLALVDSLVRLHGGDVRAESAGAGHGSTFTVQLPLLDPLAVLGASALDTVAVPSRRVLVVEDNEDSALSLQLVLELGGHVVHVARDGAEAITAFDAFRPQAVLCDIGLPAMDGYEVARRLRAMGPRGAAVLLVALTGYGMEDDLRRAEEAGFDAHLTKPADVDRVEALLRSAPDS